MCNAGCITHRPQGQVCWVPLQSPSSYAKWKNVPSLHHSHRNAGSFKPLSEVRDQTCTLMDTSQVLNPLSHNGNSTCGGFLGFFLFFCFCLFAFSRTNLMAYGGTQGRGRIGAVAAGLHQSHSNARWELCLRPTPQLTATPDPSPNERGQGSNPQPHGS